MVHNYFACKDIVRIMYVSLDFFFLHMAEPKIFSFQWDGGKLQGDLTENWRLF